MAVTTEDNIADCVKEKMHHIAQEKGGKFTKKEQKQALGKSFGICRQESDSVKICDDCKKEKPLFYQKLCKKCYLKRVKNYVDKYDMGDIIVKILDDFTVSAHFRKGKPVKQFQKIEKASRSSVANILHYAITQLKQSIKSLEKDLARAFKSAKPFKYKEILIQINKKKEGIEKIRAELRKRGWKDMDEDQLRKVIIRLDKETKSMNSLEKESYFRAHLMPYFSTGMIKTNAQKLAQNAIILQQDAIAGGIRQKLAEKRERSIFFKPFRPLERLREISKTRGKLSSSNVVGMEYSDSMLKVTFNWEGLGEVEYGYDVGPEFYESMAKAPSKGKFVWSALRGKTPGYVIDNPAKKTPGGVGGSIVPYTKITKRKIQGKEFKRLQKHYAGMLKGKVKVVAHMPFVRKRQKVLSRESKPFKKVPDGDFVLIKIKELSDAIPVKKHTRIDPRTGKTIEVKAFDRTGTKKAQLIAKAKRLGKTPLPKTKSQLKQEKLEAKEKVSTQRRAVSSEEKRRRETEKQARGIKATPAPEPREEAIQKLIEETGLERKEAEKQIAKLMGLSPEQAKKKAETKQRQEQFKTKNKEFGAKLTALNELNKKIQSTPLTNIIKLLLKGFMLIATGKSAKSVLNQFKNFYGKLQKEKKLDQNQRKKLVLYVSKLHKELETLSKSSKDFEYISAAVDVCAKRKVVQSGGKGNYNAYVAECIRIIGISRRKAGLSRRSGGTAGEVRRGQRRERTQARRQPSAFERRMQRNRERRERHEAVQQRLYERGLREREWQRAGAILDRQREERRLQREHAAQYLREREEREAIQTRQEGLTALRQNQVKLQRYMREPDFDAAQTIINLSKRQLRKLESIPLQKVEWTRAVHRWQEELDTAKQIREEGRAHAEERMREILQRSEAREAVRATRQRNIQERRALRQSEAVSASTLNQSEARVASEVMHIEIPRETFTPESYQRRYMSFSEALPPSTATLSPPAGTRQTRRGYWTTAGVWRNPVFRTPEQISATREAGRQRRRTSGIHAVYTGQTIETPRRRETARQQAARRHRRRRRGPKMRWRTRITLGGRNYKSLSEISRADLQSGMRLVLNPVAKKDYDFENPDFNPAKAEREGNRRRIQIRKGVSAGVASFIVENHPVSGTYLYLGTLEQKPDFRGRNASSILKPAIMWADSQDMVIGGSPSPIGRESEVAPAHLSPEEQRTWRYSNSADLKRFYKKLGGFANIEYGGSFARFPHPERIGRARASDLVKRIKIKLDSRRKLIFFKNPKINIAMIGGYHFYYDPEKDLFYQLDTNAKRGK